MTQNSVLNENEGMRPRIFISSIEKGYEEIRDAAERAIVNAGFEPVRAERFPSHRTSPRNGCLDAVATSDGVVVILGKRYAGELPVSGLSAVEEEFDEARRLHKQILVYVEQTDHEPRQSEFIKKVSDFVTGHWRNSFSDAIELETLVENNLKRVMPMTSSSNERDARRRLDNASQIGPPRWTI
jgi:hypothetical protein